MEFLANIWKQICDFTMKYVVEPIKGIDVRDVVDILLLAFLLFALYRFFHKRRAGRVVIGITVTVLFSVLAVYFELSALSYLVKFFASVAFFCAVVIFQPELRDTFEHIGNLTLFNPGSNSLPKRKMALANEVADEMTDAVMTMAENRVGALIVFEGLTKLGDYTHGGCIIDARVSSKLLQNIFYDGSPLHDGALIIRKMRIYAANCVLPSSTRKNFNFGMMGTRHRAAVGVTEVSDALVIVVSEQTGRVSVAQNGMLVRDFDAKTLKDILMTYMAGNAYLRKKRATVRQENLELLEKIARVERIDADPEEKEAEKALEKAEDKKPEKEAEKEIEKKPALENKDATDAEEQDASLESVDVLDALSKNKSPKNDHSHSKKSKKK